MSKIIDITGKKYTRLQVLKRVENSPSGQTRWLCRCDCGNEKIIMRIKLKSGNTKSCGCLNSELARARLIKHGLSDAPEHGAWLSMKQRCYNHNNPQYKDWGGRGITVYKRWLNSFENFYSDMGDKPSSGHSIDRKNNDGNYTPENCRWADSFTQGRNRRNAVVYTYNGKTMNLQQWADEVGIKRLTLSARIHNCKWSIEKTLMTPVQHRAS